MVRLRTFEVRSAKSVFQALVQRGLNIEALNNLTLGSIYFNLCEGKFDWQSSSKPNILAKKILPNRPSGSQLHIGRDIRSHLSLY